MRRFALPLLLILPLALAACAPSQAASGQPVPQPLGPAGQEAVPSPTEPADAPGDLVRIDQQGAVTMEVTPLNLSNPSDNLEFDVVLDTHSVDLSMDLAALATLTTDTGMTVQAAGWDAPRGGHHVGGKLIFPALKDGKSILEGASKLSLTITNLDAPSRVFEWGLK